MPKRASDDAAGPSAKRARTSIDLEHALSGEPADANVDDEERMRERVWRRLEAQRSKAGEIAEHGIIESLYMENFMCHDRLAFEFGPQMNLIVGQNGSGKSAALSALQLALGSKTSLTGRGSTLRSYIKEGKTWALVRVGVKNCGEDAYKYDVYGSCIYVERRFTTDGASSYKIYGASYGKDKHSKVISTRRAELTAICDHMNIQVDNPLNILTQDNARQFLAASKPREMYNFFMEGTQLGEVLRTYESIRTGIDNLKRTADFRTVNDEVAAKERFDRALVRHDAAEKAQQMSDERERLEEELAWALVRDKREEVDDANRPLKKSRKRLQQIEQELLIAQEEYDAATKRVASLEDALPTVSDAEDAEASRIKAEIRAKKGDLAVIKQDAKHFSDSKERGDRRITELKSRIAEENAKLELATQEVMKDFHDRLSAKRENIKTAELELESAEADVSRLEQELDNAKLAARLVSEQRTTAKDDIVRLEEAVRRAEQQKRDAFAAYGPHTARIRDDIDKMQWAGERKPFGPLGMYVGLVEQEYGTVIRNLLGRLLFGFVVSDVRDLKPLKQLLMRYKANNQITVASTDLFDFSAGVAPDGVPTVLRALNVQDEWVLRVLINGHHVEALALAPNRLAGQRLLESSDDRVRRVLTADERRVVRHPGGGWETNALSKMRPDDPRHRLFKSAPEVEQDIQRQREELQAATRRLGAKEATIADQRTKLQSTAQVLSRSKSQVEQHRRQLNRLRSDLVRLQDEANAAAPVNVSGLEQTLAEQEAEMEDLVKQFETMVKRQAEIVNELKPLVTRSDELRCNRERVEEDMLQTKRTLEEAVIERLRKENAVHHWRDKRVKEQAAVEELESKADFLSKELLQWTEGAKRILSEEHRTPRSTAQLQAKVESLQQAVDNHEREQGASLEEIHLEVMNAKKSYEEEKARNMALYQLSHTMERALAKRQGKWKGWRGEIAMRCKGLFQLHLYARNFDGKALFDHELCELELQVHPMDLQMQAQTLLKGKDKDPRSLSGGEKSFSTICWLLALWESIGCPIRCLDEFDVFMDAVNRRVSMKMMMESAKASDSKQHILISPQGLENVSYGDEVKVLKMEDPARRHVM